MGHHIKGHVEVHLPKDKPRVAKSFVDDLQRAYETGGKRTFMPVKQIQTSAFYDLPHCARQELVSLARGIQSARKAVYAAYFQGAINGCSKTANSTVTSIWGSQQQQEMQKALLWLPQSARIDFLDWIYAKDQGRIRCFGAAAVEKISLFFLNFGWKVFLPHLFEDIAGKIDLITYSRTSRKGFLLQVKCRLDKDDLFFRHETMINPSAFCRSQQTQRGWQPVRVIVGINDHDIRKLSVPHGLHRGLKNLLKVRG